MLKFVWAGRPASFYTWLSVILLASVFVGHFSRSEHRSYRVEFVLETEQAVNFDIYYDIGRGYNEVDHQSTMLEETSGPTKVSFCIPVWSELEKLRFDPASEHVKMILHSLTLYDDTGRPFMVDLETLSPKQQIMEYDFDGTRYTFETAVDGDDPIIEVQDIALSHAGSGWKGAGQYITWISLGVFCFLLGGFLHRFFLLGL